MTRSALIAACLLMLLPFAVDAAPREEQLTFQSDGHPIRIDVYRPSDNDRFHPAVIVLHPTGGLTNPLKLTHLCTRLAENGFAAYLVHYFDRTGHVTASADDCQTYSATWLRTIDDAVHFISIRSEIDGRRIAVVGMSLGGCLALAEGATNPLVSRVVEFYGRLAWPDRVTLTRMVPALILHGEADNENLVSEAYEVMRQMDSLKVPYEYHIYPGEGHGFSRDTEIDAVKRTIQFLKRL